MRRSGVRWLWLAAVPGLVHAAFSLYWGVGGRWLLPTVGAWATDLATSRVVLSAVALVGIGLVKVAGSLVPIWVESRRPATRRLWRGLSWAGAVVLVVYGGLNTVVAWLVLGGVLGSEGGYDRSAMIGHAALWDPLFLLWGALLATGLWASRDSSGGVRAS